MHQLIESVKFLKIIIRYLNWDPICITFMHPFKSKGPTTSVYQLLACLFIVHSNIVWIVVVMH